MLYFIWISLTLVFTWLPKMQLHMHTHWKLNTRYSRPTALWPSLSYTKIPQSFLINAFDCHVFSVPGTMLGLKEHQSICPGTFPPFDPFSPHATTSTPPFAQGRHWGLTLTHSANFKSRNVTWVDQVTEKLNSIVKLDQDLFWLYDILQFYLFHKAICDYLSFSYDANKRGKNFFVCLIQKGFDFLIFVILKWDDAKDQCSY